MGPGCSLRHGPVHPIFRHSQALRSIEHPKRITDRRHAHGPASRQRAMLLNRHTDTKPRLLEPPVNFRWQAPIGAEAVESLSAG